MSIYKSKYDYTKKYRRSNVHTTIADPVYEQFQIQCIKLKQPQTKCLDVILDMVLNDQELLKEFVNRVRNY